MQKILWLQTKTLPSRAYRCGYCGSVIASEKGYSAHLPNHNADFVDAVIMVCHKCHRPTFLDTGGQQSPGITFGNDVADISEKSVEDLYREARGATGAGCYTLAAMACRKLLMNIAVAKGAIPGDSFISYVEFLSKNNYIPPDAKDWVDHIRTKGNEANHEIVITKREDAEELLAFIEMLLKVIFEFPAQIKKKYAKKV